MKRGEQLYEGKAKRLFATDDPGLIIQYFKDDATAFDAQKRGTIRNKGVINNAISSHLFKLLEREGVRTHFVEKLSEREMLVRRLEIIPVEVVVRNVVAGSLAKRFGLEEGAALKKPLLEFYYKRDDLRDPMMNEDHILAFGFATEEELSFLKEVSQKVNRFLSAFFDERDIMLVDFKLEFGRCPTEGGALLLGDEITPDGCRLWEKGTLRKLDKDRFRRDLGQIEEAYEEVHRRVLS